VCFDWCVFLGCSFSVSTSSGGIPSVFLTPSEERDNCGCRTELMQTASWTMVHHSICAIKIATCMALSRREDNASGHVHICSMLTIDRIDWYMPKRESELKTLQVPIALTITRNKSTLTIQAPIIVAGGNTSNGLFPCLISVFDSIFPLRINSAHCITTGSAPCDATATTRSPCV
jgi:hypothetical protein